MANESVALYFAKTGMIKNLTNLSHAIRLYETISAPISDK
ncbi:MAG: hypothetical protein K0Q90_1791 [Paenibacillaceae bacterium]|nr:hypothetical protein [Paenibacillaceae bacterium]